MRYQLCEVYGKKVWLPIQESKTYIKDPSEAPAGTSLKTGPHGGHYYEDPVSSNEKPEETQTQNNTKFTYYSRNRPIDKIWFNLENDFEVSNDGRTVTTKTPLNMDDLKKYELNPILDITDENGNININKFLKKHNIDENKLTDMGITKNDILGEFKGKIDYSLEEERIVKEIKDLIGEPEETQIKTPKENPKKNEVHIFRKFKRGEPGTGAEVKFSSKEEVNKVLEQGNFSLISAGRNPNNKLDMNLSDEQIQERDIALKKELIARGYKFTPILGKYGEEEDSFLVMTHDPDTKDMTELGEKFNQDSIVVVKSGSNRMIFTSGENKGRYYSGSGHQEIGDEASDFYSELIVGNEKVRFSLNFNFDKTLSEIYYGNKYFAESGFQNIRKSNMEASR